MYVFVWLCCVIYIVHSLSFRVDAAQLKIRPSILHQIGITPLVQINKIPKSFGLQCQMCKFCCIFWTVNYNLQEGCLSLTERVSVSAISLHFGLPWVRPWDNRGKCYMDEKRI